MDIDGVIKLMRDGKHARLEQRLDDARRDFAAAVDLCRQSGARRELIQALKGLGQIERDHGRGVAALALYEEAVLICREEDDQLQLARSQREFTTGGSAGGRIVKIRA